MAARNTRRINTTPIVYDRYGNPIRRGNSAQRRSGGYTGGGSAASYQHGATARKLKEAKRPGYDYYQERRYREEYEIKERERRVKRKEFLIRKIENAMSFRNFVFVGIASMAVVVICIFYLSLISTISIQSTQLNNLQSEFVALQEENNNRYNQLNSSMSLEEVREHAVGTLGMVNATTDQIVTYQDPSTDYVTQNESIPK